MYAVRCYPTLFFWNVLLWKPVTCALYTCSSELESRLTSLTLPWQHSWTCYHGNIHDHVTMTTLMTTLMRMLSWQNRTLVNILHRTQIKRACEYLSTHIFDIPYIWLTYIWLTLIWRFFRAQFKVFISWYFDSKMLIRTISDSTSRFYREEL